MLREIKGTQLKPRLLAFKLTGSGTAALNEGAFDAALTDNGTGDYTLTFTKPFARAPIVSIVSMTEETNIKAHAVAAASIQIKTFGVDGTTAKDAVLQIMVLGWDDATQF